MLVKRALAAASAAAVVLLLAAASAVYFAPFQTSVALRRFALWRGGVRRVAAGPLLAYEKNGCREGEPCRCVALVHGLGDSALTWDKTLLGAGGAWPPPPGIRFLAVDLPGTDGSAPAADYGIRAQARVVREALSARCPRWTVAGNSLGGWIASWLALDWPEGVERLVLINAAGFTDPTGQALETAKTLADPTVEKMKEFSSRSSGRPRVVPERAWAAVVASIRARPTKAIYAALTLDDVLDAKLKGVRADAELVWGGADRILPPSFGERFHAALRGSRLTVVPGCGHLPQQECPESVSRALYGAAR